MGITIVQKSDLSRPKADPRIALVLSGGGVSGGAFKLGGLQALNNCMLNRKVREFDIFVGISAGAIISAYLANGVPVSDIIQSMEGKGGQLGTIRASELYSLNYMDFLTTPTHILEHTLGLAFKGSFDFLMSNNIFRKDFRDALTHMLCHPTYENIIQFIQHCLRRKESTVQQPSLPWHFIPNGIFTTDKFEKSNRKNLESEGFSNDFKELYEKTGKSLYIVAMTLDNAQRAVFGHDQIHTASISKAMQASIALPLFYKPVRIDGVDYIDGAVIKTTSMDLAVEKGADLVICYNPFRPFDCDSFSAHCKKKRERLYIAEDGVYAVLNQVMRTLLHTRLMRGIESYQKNPDFKGDIIVIEPTEYDDQFFDMNPMAFWTRRKAAQRGYESVRQSIRNHYDQLKAILASYGIAIDPDFVKDLEVRPEAEMPNACVCFDEAMSEG